MPSVRRALRILHENYHVPHVVMSSIPLHNFLRDALPPNLSPKEHNSEINSSYLLCISSSCTASGNGSATPDSTDYTSVPSIVHAHVLPCIPGYFSGVGDLFSAMVLAHFQPTSMSKHSSVQTSLSNGIDNATHTPLSIAVSHALSKTFGMLRFTHEQVSATHPESEDATDEERDRADPERQVRRMRTRELRLIQGQHILRATPIPMSNKHEGDGCVIELREMRPWNDFWI